MLAIMRVTSESHENKSEHYKRHQWVTGLIIYMEVQFSHLGQEKCTRLVRVSRVSHTSYSKDSEFFLPAG
jgi:hypothetical protein